LTKAIRRTFGRDTPIQRCQVHKSRNIIDRLPKSLHASVRKTLRQAWELDDAETAEKLLRNLARRLEQIAPGVGVTARSVKNCPLSVVGEVGGDDT
jgi:transposase-like protein